MSSIIEGYSYDIFLSYRQKDNKGERWVSEFVESLKTELEATFKEDISIYFDENPHDGLLETHDVDASLKEKLKCLIFIPIISRTYCDPKAFAWEHEFLAFIKLASADSFGLKVTLPSGNVATRILPVRIHELGLEDTRLCETALGGVLRGVDFIYKAPGVNRPLRMNEDHPKNNLNKTYYRDQINKVANAISDIIHSLKPGRTDFEPKSNETKKKISGGVSGINNLLRRSFTTRKAGKRWIALFAFFACLLIAYSIFTNNPLTGNEKTIAFIRLENASNDSTIINYASDFIELVNQKLRLVKDISIIPEFLTDQYDESEKSMRMIRRDLKANYILYGKIRRENREVKIVVELSGTRDNKILWNKTYSWNNNVISKNLREIVRMIAVNMDILLSPEEEKLIDTELSNNPEINMKIISANKDLNDAWDFYNYRDKYLDSTSFTKAIAAYNKIIKQDSGSAISYAKRAIAWSWGYYLGEFDSTSVVNCRKDIDKAMSIDKELPEVEVALGFYYYYCLEQNDKALDHFAIASAEDPGNYKPIFYMALACRRLGRWEECRRLIQKVTKFNVHEALFLTNIGMTYSFFHDYDSALIYHQKAIDMIPVWPAGYKNKFITLILKSGLTDEAKAIIDDALQETGSNMIEYRILFAMYEKNYPEALLLAEKAVPDDFDYPEEKYIYMAKLSSYSNDTVTAEKSIEKAKSVIEQAIRNKSDSYFLHSYMGLVYAYLGDRNKAVTEAEKAVQMASERNMMDENEMKMFRAQTYIILGDYDNAFPIILYLLNNPSFLSKKLLELDPVWKPIMNQPEYRKRIRRNT